tara:strand:- start:303 stop:1766 length:1464 start_codon:yes stop_codon:yes gene_type:complete
MDKEDCKYYLPHNLDLVSLEKEHPPKFVYCRDKAMYLLSLINTIPANNRSKYADSQGWIPINSTTIQDVSIRNFPKYKAWFIDTGIIECDGQYIVEEKSYCYRFTEDYRTPISPIVYSTKSTFAKKTSILLKPLGVHTQKYPYLYKWFNDSLTIDDNAAMYYLSLRHMIDRKDDKEKALYRYNSAVIGVDKMADANHYFSVDSTAGRLHTNYTSMPREIREFTKYDGEELVSLDFKNSQPVMSTLLFAPQFWVKNETTDKNGFLLPNSNVLDTTFFNFYNLSSKFLPILNISTYTTSAYTSPLMLAEMGVPIENEDVGTYITEVLKGELYEYIEKRVQELNGDYEERTRKEIKTMIFTIMFSGNKKSSSEKDLFKQLFPSVYTMFAFIKRTKKELLPIMLQTIESKLFLDRIARRIAKERPELPIFTIHDSITTTVGNESYVERIMEEETIKAIGVRPSISIEYWSQSNIDWVELKKQAGIITKKTA